MHPVRVLVDVHGFAQVAEERAGFAEGDGRVEALTGGADESGGVVVDAADWVCFVQVRVETCA